MEKRIKKKEETVAGLINIVFSWSLEQIMDQHLYRDKVHRIPDTFSSSNEYLNSFITPLIEETHSDLRSNMTSLPSLPVSEVVLVRTCKKFDPVSNLQYKIMVNRVGEEKKRVMYEPEFGDLFALTHVVPKCVNDLTGINWSYIIASVTGGIPNDPIIIILSSKPIAFRKPDKKNGTLGRLFAVHLTNMVTNIRIWCSLRPKSGSNTKILDSVLSVDPSMGENCIICNTNKIESVYRSNSDLFRLDESQRAAVLNCIALTKCLHKNSVRLIWGPPGTGKTNTTASLLYVLLKMKCRVLTCAPTNVAVVGVAKRLMGYVNRKSRYDTYGLGDIVLFGNGERMKIDEHEDLHDIFLHHRVSVQTPLTGWMGAVDGMIRLLENPRGCYDRFLSQHEVETDEEEGADVETESKKVVESENLKGTLAKNKWKELIVKDINKNKKKKSKQKGPSSQRSESSKAAVSKKVDNDSLMSFKEFFKKQFFASCAKLELFLTGLYAHLPTNFLSYDVMTKILRLLDHLAMLGRLLRNRYIDMEDCLEGSLVYKEESRIKLESLAILNFLWQTLKVPNFINYSQIRNFCLANARLVFCTASSSAKLHTEGMAPLDLVIIDEAAQLKECESCIPLQLHGLRHAVLVGDKIQLPAMVISKVCEKAGFGRSLFERLVGLTVNQHLLNIQYRMHPFISSFPNNEFYGNRIKNGPNVMAKAYDKRFLKGKLFGAYSFINVSNGKEEFDNRHSRKNTAEVSVVAAIVAKLHTASVRTKKKIRVGCISPYKAQVFAMQESLGKTYSSDADAIFSVNIRSIDSFQGGEEDIIIFSTVRCNGNGSIFPIASAFPFLNPHSHSHSGR